MKVLYLDCGMGAAGDMLTASLLELLPDPDAFTEKLNSIGIPDVVFTREKVHSCGIAGTHMSVKIHGEEESDHHHHHHHHHSSLHDIGHIISHIHASDTVKQNVMEIYQLIAEAESLAHGVPVSEVHFHEVGAMDAVADITAVCMLMEELSPDEVIASPIHVGSGYVKCAHGLLPVPAPATAHILRGLPIYSADIKTELCTPTGAALLKHFVHRFGELPDMCISATGYGMGKKEFDRPNCVRAILGESSDRTDRVYELSCNLDDMTAEEIGFAQEQLFAGGALDVYTLPINMKKSRPGTLLSVICRGQEREDIIRLIFRHTTTLGIREIPLRRYTLERSIVTVDTPFGPIRRKDACGYGISRSKYEYDDLAEIAGKHGLSLSELKKQLP